MPKLSRREFLKLSGAAALGMAFTELDLQLLDPVDVPNPLALYPDRDWEKVYRDQYRYDTSFTYVCSPNDPHACRLRAFVRNSIILRSETNYDVSRYGDLYGNTATAHWHPRKSLYRRYPHPCSRDLFGAQPVDQFLQAAGARV